MWCKKCDSLGKTSSWKNLGVHGLLYRCVLLHRMNTCVWVKGSKCSITRGFSPSPPNFSTKYSCDALLKYQNKSSKNIIITIFTPGLASSNFNNTVNIIEIKEKVWLKAKLFLAFISYNWTLIFFFVLFSHCSSVNC